MGVENDFAIATADDARCLSEEATTAKGCSRRPAWPTWSEAPVPPAAVRPPPAWFVSLAQIAQASSPCSSSLSQARGSARDRGSGSAARVPPGHHAWPCAASDAVAQCPCPTFRDFQCMARDAALTLLRFHVIRLALLVL